MGALALATEAPQPSLLERTPYAATASLISPRMWRFIAVQSVLQLVLVLGIVVVGEAVLGIDAAFLAATGRYAGAGAGTAPTVQDVFIYKSTLVFNVFVRLAVITRRCCCCCKHLAATTVTYSLPFPP